MLGLADELRADDVAFRAPQAYGYTWYPNSFLAPVESNEPWLSSAIRTVKQTVDDLERGGIPVHRIVILGFSQGACLALETAARNARRYGGIVAFSGGLIGTGEKEGAAPPDDKLFQYDGSFYGTPVFLGCSDVDPHIPLARVRTTTDVLRRMEAEVTEQIYPGMGHHVNEDELEFARTLLAAM
jgi:phospholipase/carboxylesterase